MDRRRLASDSLTYPVPTEHCTPTGSADSFFSSVVTTPHHRCLVANMAWDCWVSARRMLTILGFWFVAQTALTSTSHVSLQLLRERRS